jgi:tetratricopeptide (TPR) repeat protein
MRKVFADRPSLWYDGAMPTIEQLEKLLTLDPSDPFVHYGLGQEYANAGDHEQAIGCYSKAIELDATYCYAYYFKGQSLDELGQTDNAREVIRDGIKAAEQIADAHAVSELSDLLESMT